MISMSLHSHLRMYGFLLPLFFLLIPDMRAAQSDSLHRNINQNHRVYEFDFESGGILMQKDLKDITYKNAYFQGAHFRMGWKQNGGNDKYNMIYNNPVYGIGFLIGTFNNNIIGNPYAVYGFVQIPSNSDDNKRWTYDYRISLGLSDDFKPFDKTKNPSNLVIGSYTNVYIDFGLKVQYRINPHWKAGVGLAFHHFSNGALALPNKGINLVPLSLSINYQPHPSAKLHRLPVILPYPKKWMYHFNVGAGLKQLNEDKDKLYFKTSWCFYASRHISYKWRIGAGADIFYSSSGIEKDVAGDKSGKISSLLSGGPAFYLVHILNERLVLNGNIGYYIHNLRFNGEISKFFLRAGIRYYVYQNINAGVSIKAHMGKADFIEWSLGYTFNR